MDDALLVEAYRGGDANAFALLVKRHSPRVFAFALRMTNDPHCAEDITQIVFFRAWKGLSTYDRNKKFITWLLAITRNTSIDLLRKKHPIPFSFFRKDDDDSHFAENIPDPLPLPDEVVASVDMGSKLNEALQKLSPSERALLSLHYEHDLTFEEIAQIEQKSRDTLKSQHRRALIKLRALLAPLEQYSC